MENKELTIKISRVLGEILSRLLVVEIQYQKKWNEEEGNMWFKDRLYYQLECRKVLNQLNAYGIKDYLICDYSKIGNDY